MDRRNAADEFGMACQRLVPWALQADEPPFGVMACFLPSGRASAPDCHDQDEVMIVLSGTGTVEVGGEHGEIRSSDVVVLPRNNVHIVRNDGAGVLSWVSFYWPLHEPANASAAGTTA
jgi:mannose-6-phosphate isomerase-like protein (cupin superfamily)